MRYLITLNYGRKGLSGCLFMASITLKSRGDAVHHLDTNTNRPKIKGFKTQYKEGGILEASIVLTI